VNSKGTWFITGASSGFGREIALAVIASGGKVIATARNPAVLDGIVQSAPERAMAVALDVTDKQQLANALAAAEQRFGSIDVLVNNAGYGLIGSIEEADEAAIRRVFEVNFFGMVAVTRALLPGFRARRRGWIVNISSVAGLVGLIGSGYYSASKFAMEGFSEALRSELEPFGIGLMMVEPGMFRTEFLGSAVVRAAEHPDYVGTVGKMMELIKHMRGKEPGDPVRAAKAIITALDSDKPPQQLLLGAGAIDRVSRKLNAQHESVDKWRELTVSADYPPA
jgi:NAD(P)-dependent dehydrogenase (short-subunit alcohol dehydrogenase family)